MVGVGVGGEACDQAFQAVAPAASAALAASDPVTNSRRPRSFKFPKRFGLFQCLNMIVALEKSPTGKCDVHGCLTAMKEATKPAAPPSCAFARMVSPTSAAA